MHAGLRHTAAVPAQSSCIAAQTCWPLTTGLSHTPCSAQHRAARGSHVRPLLQLAASADDTPAADNSSSNAAPYDPSLAAGFRAPPGKQQLWWVEAFEARRKAAAAGAPASPATQSPDRRVPFPGGSALLQLAQLAVAVGALIVWPAALASGGLYTARVWLLAAAYYVFFAGGSVYRLLRHGALAPRSKDEQAATLGSRLSQLLFVVALPVLHWTAVGRFITQRGTYMLTAYDVIGAVLIPAAIGLNLWAASHLGAAYDRVVAPQQLVTSGPYAWVQHPIYTSYMLLFCGAMMSLHSAPCAVMVLAVCLLYYKQRTSLERRVLVSAFGEQYEAYTRRALGRFLPGL